MKVTHTGIEDAWQIKEMFGDDAKKWDWPEWVIKALGRGTRSQENSIEWDHGILTVRGKDANLGFGEVDDWLLKNARGDLYVVSKEEFWADYKVVITKDGQ